MSLQVRCAFLGSPCQLNSSMKFVFLAERPRQVQHASVICGNNGISKTILAKGIFTQAAAGALSTSGVAVRFKFSGEKFSRFILSAPWQIARRMS
jgi:hypothetical protein